MSRKFTFTALAVALGLVAGACSEQVGPTSANDTGFTDVTGTANAGGGVLHHASMGGADICEAIGLPTGCDANFSLTAKMKDDGGVSVQWQDTFRPVGGEGIHVASSILANPLASSAI